ncbi:MAG TPA: gluconate 2-dehydrogenase subunit 3 family protein, partial [Yinghuangia sp.]|nr:gluconate 2-dehydrogenase subunit 3 family protein [Yinghuangia sp.]
MRENITRKVFLRQAAGFGALLAGTSLVTVGAPPSTASPSSAEPPAALEWTRTIEAWCDLLVPGAADHGVVDFVTTQLAKKPDDALLGIRYFDWPPPWAGFYQAGANALDAASRARFGVPFVMSSG